MRRAAGLTSALRSATVVAGGAVAVHQLRYLVGYGGDAPRALSDQGHAYIEALVPILALLAGLTVLATVLAGLAGARSTRRRAPLARTLLYGGAILAVFGAQEIVEGLVVAAHPGGIAAVAAHGGLVVLPLAAACGWLTWAAVRSLEELEERLGERAEATPRPPRAILLRPLLGPGLHPVALAAGAAPRAPPAA